MRVPQNLVLIDTIAPAGINLLNGCCADVADAPLPAKIAMAPWDESGVLSSPLTVSGETPLTYVYWVSKPGDLTGIQFPAGGWEVYWQTSLSNWSNEVFLSSVYVCHADSTGSPISTIVSATDLDKDISGNPYVVMLATESTVVFGENDILVVSMQLYGSATFDFNRSGCFLEPPVNAGSDDPCDNTFPPPPPICEAPTPSYGNVVIGYCSPGAIGNYVEKPPQAPPAPPNNGGVTIFDYEQGTIHYVSVPLHWTGTCWTGLTEYRLFQFEQDIIINTVAGEYAAEVVGVPSTTWTNATVTDELGNIEPDTVINSYQCLGNGCGDGAYVLNLSKPANDTLFGETVTITQNGYILVGGSGYTFEANTPCQQQNGTYIGCYRDTLFQDLPNVKSLVVGANFSWNGTFYQCGISITEFDELGRPLRKSGMVYPTSKNMHFGFTVDFCTPINSEGEYIPCSPNSTDLLNMDNYNNLDCDATSFFGAFLCKGSYDGTPQIIKPANAPPLQTLEYFDLPTVGQQVLPSLTDVPCQQCVNTVLGGFNLSCSLSYVGLVAYYDAMIYGCFSAWGGKYTLYDTCGGYYSCLCGIEYCPYQGYFNCDAFGGSCYADVSCSCDLPPINVGPFAVCTAGCYHIADYPQIGLITGYSAAQWPLTTMNCCCECSYNANGGSGSYNAPYYSPDTYYVIGGTLIPPDTLAFLDVGWVGEPVTCSASWSFQNTIQCNPSYPYPPPTYSESICYQGGWSCGVMMVPGYFLPGLNPGTIPAGNVTLSAFGPQYTTVNTEDVFGPAYTYKTAIQVFTSVFNEINVDGAYNLYCFYLQNDGTYIVP